MAANKSGTRKINGLQRAGENFTHVQMAKQHTSGIDFHSKVLAKMHDGMNLESSASTVVIDLFGYDGWAAEATFASSVSSNQHTFCATVCHTAEAKEFVYNILTRAVFNARRKGEFDLKGFPHFATLVEAVNANSKCALDIKLNVTTLLPCGALIISDSLTHKWFYHEFSRDKMQELLEANSEEFDKDNTKFTNKRGADEASDEPVPKTKQTELPTDASENGSRDCGQVSTTRVDG